MKPPDTPTPGSEGIAKANEAIERAEERNGPGVGVVGAELPGVDASTEELLEGEPGAAIRERLEQGHDSTSRVKAKSRKLPTSVRQFYSLFLFGSASLSDLSATLEGTPSANLVISNMVGPQEQLYMPAQAVLSKRQNCSMAGEICL